MFKQENRENIFLYPNVTHVHYVAPLQLWIKFADGKHGVYNFTNLVYNSPEGSVFRIFLDDEYFQRAYVDRTVSVAVVNDHREVLMMWRHRFIPNMWVWELPDGIIEPGETPEDAAIREALNEETGYLVNVKHIATFSPAPGLIDAPHTTYVTREYEKITDPSDAEEVSVIEWIPLSEVRGLLAKQKIGGAGSIIFLLTILAEVGNPRP